MIYYRRYSGQEVMNSYFQSIFPLYKGPEIPCLRIIKKCIGINTAVRRGNMKVCKL
uniref:ORF55b n=1 Tax=Pinus koraiensis TaxID=88728 RepID=A4QM52_PINKO|nr:ORF55b [Pinus koraiensis]ABP35389.1 ORF55b [Pinus koraiensis]